MKQLSIIVFVLSVSVLGAGRLSAQGGFSGIHAASEFTSNVNLLLIGGGALVINSNFYLGGSGYGV